MKSKNYKYILICGALLCNGVSSISVAHANTTDTIERKEETIITKEKQSMDALSVDLTWQDLEDIDHSKDTVKVQLLKNGKPYEGEVELGTTKWKHTWDFSNYLGWQNNNWELKVVKNKEGYKPQIRFNYKTNTFEFTNQQEKKEKNVKVLTKLKWSDSEEVDHNKDRIKVQWYKDGKPEGNAVELGYWIHEWVMTEEEANEKGWELKVVENKEGYEPQIKYDEKTRTYEIVNMKVTGKLNITMSDKHENGIFLKGAVFEVKDKEGKVVGQVMTDVNGKASLELASGEYTIKQIKAPEGYQLLDDVYKVNVTKQGQKLFLDIKNQKEINQSKEDIVVDDIKDSQPKEEVVIEESVSSNGNREESKYEKNNVTNVKAEQKNASKKEVEKQQTNNTKHLVQEQKKSIEKSEDRKESKINEKETVNTSDKTNAYIWWLATASAILMMICSIKYKLCKKSDK